jgi:DNA repair protein RecO
VSYYIYTSEGIILEKQDVGEADRVFRVFTKDFGLLKVKARGVRYLKSKLRYYLSGLSLIKISFLATSNDCWGLVDAEEIKSFVNIKNNFHKTECAMRIMAFLGRLVQGQETDRELWQRLKNLLVFLDRRQLAREDLDNLLLFSSLKIASHLGYIDDLDPFVSLRKIAQKREFFKNKIKYALELSML